MLPSFSFIPLFQSTAFPPPPPEHRISPSFPFTPSPLQSGYVKECIIIPQAHRNLESNLLNSNKTNYAYLN